MSRETLLPIAPPDKYKKYPSSPNRISARDLWGQLGITWVAPRGERARPPRAGLSCTARPRAQVVGVSDAPAASVKGKEARAESLRSGTLRSAGGSPSPRWRRTGCLISRAVGCSGQDAGVPLGISLWVSCFALTRGMAC